MITTSYGMNNGENILVILPCPYFQDLRFEQILADCPLNCGSINGRNVTSHFHGANKSFVLRIIKNITRITKCTVSILSVRNAVEHSTV